MAKQASRLGVLGLDGQRLAVEDDGLGHIAQQREVGDVPGGLRHPRRASSAARICASYSRSKASSAASESPRASAANAAANPATLSGRRLGQLARQLVDRAPQRVDLVGLQMTRPLQFRHARLRCAGVAQQRVEVGLRRQSARPRNLGDQAARVVLPAVFGDSAGIPASNSGRNSDGRSAALGTSAPSTSVGHQREVAAGQRRDQFVTDHVVCRRAVEASCPRSPNADRSRPRRPRFAPTPVDLVAPLARRRCCARRGTRARGRTRCAASRRAGRSPRAHRHDDS